eukprot:CAMPEP_0194415116 /NCGR_PEP_ID=MMETSP0176-20130528/13865_1 /TAXON_ID=216777 /ORGANISM="Proboscia alata, Strain PI-D3" /LENGTH=49 /DNA_ID=CAMNT_0039219557 /DNA_START=24 /DNA_END=173 /DNA_ORIENTATION=-
MTLFNSAASAGVAPGKVSSPAKRAHTATRSASVILCFMEFGRSQHKAGS